MKQRLLGKSGLAVSEIGLGCWQLGGDFGPVDDASATEILEQASQSEINFWDTADVYGAGLSEQRIGDWLQQHPNQPKVVATKVGRDASLYPNQYSKSAIQACLEASLKRLQVEALDLVQLHCIPPEVLFAGDVLAYMEDFQQQGLIRHFGASVETVEEGLFAVKHPKLTSLQILLNLFRQDAVDELLPEAQKQDVGIIVRLPLASGLLSGTMTKDRQFTEQDHRNFNKDGEFFNVGETFNGLTLDKGVDLAEQLKPMLPQGLTLAQVALRWLLDQQAVTTVIAGVSKPQQAARNAEVAGLAPLPAELHSQLKTFYYEQVRAHIRGQI